MALIEAVQQQVPVICADLEVFKELFNKEEITFFKLDDKSSLSKALKSAGETGKKKADLAYAKYRNNYNASVMAKHYWELYKFALPHD